MGKKKDERKRREREAEQAARATGCGGGDDHKDHRHKHDGEKHDGEKHAGDRHAGRKHDGTAPFAGIAAAVTRQLGTPAGRQVVAAGLMMAAAAISRQDAKTGRAASSAPLEPPVTPDAATTPEAGAKPSAEEPAANPYTGDTPEPPRGETPPLPPEMAKVIGAVTAGLETLFAGFGKSRNGPPKA